jgi:hypothetical protein
MKFEIEGKIGFWDFLYFLFVMFILVLNVANAAVTWHHFFFIENSWSVFGLAMLFTGLNIFVFWMVFTFMIQISIKRTKNKNDE